MWMRQGRKEPVWWSGSLKKSSAPPAWAINLRILLVENSGADYWRKLVSQASAELADVDVTNLQDYLRMLEAEPYDYVILDATLDGLNDLIRSVLHINVGARVLVITTSPTWQRAREAFRAGATDYVYRMADRKLMTTLRDTLQQGPSEHKRIPLLVLREKGDENSNSRGG